MIDALMARALAAELNEKLGRGRVQAVMSLDEWSVGLEVYAQHARHYLLASADPATNRVLLVGEKLRSAGTTASPFLLLLKKYVNGAFVNRVQAVPRERIVRLEFDHAEFGTSTLVVELMGRLSNLVLLDAGGDVLDSIKRVTPEMSRVRAILPREKYLPPPPQEKLDPLALTAEQLTRVLDEAQGEPLWQTLVQEVAGVSPLLGRELAFRATGDLAPVSQPRLASPVLVALQAIWHAPAEPTLAYQGEQPTAVAAFALTHLPDTRRYDSTSAALETYFGAVESYEAVKEPLRRQLAEAGTRLERKVSSLKRELVSDREIERLKTDGEMILAYQARIAPGQRVLTAEQLDGPALRIQLDPGLTPVENAQKYFAEYRRAKEAADAVPARLQEAEADVEFAEQVLVDLENAETRGEIDVVLAEAREAGLIGEGRTPKPAVAPSRPREYVSPDGFEILVGRNARQNEQVTFERAGPEDVWLHARGAAGAHVAILAQGRPVPERTVEFAAALAAYYSKARADTRVDVIVAPRKQVRRVSGRAARPGLVTVRNERTVRVRPWQP